MSRSRRRTPVYGICGRESDRYFKRRSSRLVRRLASADLRRNGDEASTGGFQPDIDTWWSKEKGWYGFRDDLWPRKMRK